MGPFEYGFLMEGCRLRHGPDDGHPPVDPEIECTAQAVREVLIQHGLSAEQTVTLLLQIAARIHALEPQLRERRRLRRVERQMRRAIGKP